MRASRIPIGIPLPPPNSSSTTSTTTNRNIIPPRRPPLLDQTNLNAINQSLMTKFSIEKHPMSISSPTKEESNVSSSSLSSSLSKGVSSPPLLSLQEIKYLATSAKKTKTCPKQPRLLDHSNNTINNNSSPPILSLQEIKYLTTCSKRNQHTTIHESSLDDVKRRLMDAPITTTTTTAAANDIPPTYYRPTSILSTTTTTTTPTPLDTKYICEFTTTQTATELVISLFQEEQRILGSITSLGDEKKGQQQGGKGGGDDGNVGKGGGRRINSTLFIKHGLLSTLTKEMENIMRNRLKSLSTQVVKDSNGGVCGGGEPIQMIYTSVYWIARARFEAYHGYMNTAWSCLNEGSIFLSKSLRVGSIRKEIGIKNKCRIEEAIVQFQEKMKLETFGGTSRNSSTTTTSNTSNTVSSSENGLASSCSNCETFEQYDKKNNVAGDEQSSSMTLPESIHDLKMQKRTDISNNEDDSSIDTDNDEANNDSNIPTTTSTTTTSTTKEQKVDGIDDLLGSFIGLTIAGKHKDRSQLTPVRRSWRRRSIREKSSESQDEAEYNHDTAFVAESSNKE